MNSNIWLYTKMLLVSWIVGRVFCLSCQNIMITIIIVSGTSLQVFVKIYRVNLKKVVNKIHSSLYTYISQYDITILASITCGCI